MGNEKSGNSSPIIIGIDPGTNTGIAVWNVVEQKFEALKTMAIDEAFDLLREDKPEFVIFEDARLRKFFGKTGRERLQGAGAAKRDSKAWEQFLLRHRIPFRTVRAQRKLRHKEFVEMTGYSKRVSEHARDAGMIVFGLDGNNLRRMVEEYERKANHHQRQRFTND